MALAERLRSDTSAFLKNPRNWVNKKCALQRRTIQNELWLMMVMMVGLMMMKMSWIKIEGLKVWGSNNATGAARKTFLHWLTEHKTLSGLDSRTRHRAHGLFTQLLTSFTSSRDKPWPLCMKWDLLELILTQMQREWVKDAFDTGQPLVENVPEKNTAPDI